MSTPSKPPRKATGAPTAPSIPGRLWLAYGRLYQLRPAGFQEVLLLGLLANVVSSGFASATEGYASFHAADAFDRITVGIKPVGFASFLPIDWVLSWGFNRLVGAVACASALLWIFKLGL